MEIAITVLGATGKMGQRVIQLAKEDPRFQIVGATKRCQTGSDVPLATACGIPFTTSPEEAMANCHVAIDFSSMHATKEHIEIATALGKGLVIGTTGLDKETVSVMNQASEKIPILYSPNFSLGIALCIDMVKRLSPILFDLCDIDIIETHHFYKKDSPSGTSLALARAIGQGEIVTAGAQETRKKGQIAIHSIRSGNAIGEHTVIFECGEERIQLTHQTHTRDAFAKGALLAAEFIAMQAPGLYSLQDLYNLQKTPVAVS